MLSTKVFASSSNAKDYYSHADYYGAEATGIWFGKGTEDFKLHGKFEAKSDEKFKDLLNGKMHDGRLLGNLDKNGQVIHRPGVDLTFSSPKSFSIQMHVLGDKKEKELLEKIFASSITGIVSTFCYILSTLALIFPPLTVIGIILCVIGILGDTAHFVIDYFSGVAEEKLLSGTP